MAGRGRCNAGAVHGDPRHHDRQRQPALYRGHLSASNDEATWTLTSYLVANGVVVPVAGWLGRLIGRKRYFLTCIAMFTVMLVPVRHRHQPAQLVMFRLLQGLFGGGLQPCQQSVLLDTFEPSQRGKGFRWWRSR